MGLTCRSGKWQAEMGQGQGGRLSLEPPQLAEATRIADARTLYRRFLGSPPHLTPDPVVVDPAWRRVGLATALIEMLVPGCPYGRFRNLK